MLVAIVGSDGSGKSTLARALAAALRDGGTPNELLDKWDIFRPALVPEARFLTGTQADMPPYIARMPGAARAMFIFWTIALSIGHRDLHDRNRLFIADGYWAKHAAVEELYGCDEDWIRRTVELFPKPDLTIYLDVDPAVALARKRDLVAYECGLDFALGAASFLEHQTNLRASLRAAAARNSWHTLSPGTPNDVLQSALRLVLSTWRTCSSAAGDSTTRADG